MIAGRSLDGVIWEQKMSVKAEILQKQEEDLSAVLDQRQRRREALSDLSLASIKSFFTPTEALKCEKDPFFFSLNWQQRRGSLLVTWSAVT